MQPSKLAESGCKHDVTKKIMHAPKTANAYTIYNRTKTKLWVILFSDNYVILTILLLMASEQIIITDNDLIN